MEVLIFQINTSDFITLFKVLNYKCSLHAKTAKGVWEHRYYTQIAQCAITMFLNSGTAGIPMEQSHIIIIIIAVCYD